MCQGQVQSSLFEGHVQSVVVSQYEDNPFRSKKSYDACSTWKFSVVNGSGSAAGAILLISKKIKPTKGIHKQCKENSSYISHKKNLKGKNVRHNTLV